MRTKFLVLCFFTALLVSCKAPLPIYFDKPIGVAVDSFPVSLQGNYYLLEDLVSKGRSVVEKDYVVWNGKILKNDSTLRQKQEEEGLNAKPVAAASEPWAAEEDNFYKIAKLNSLSYSHADSAADQIDKEKKIAFVFIQITRDEIVTVIKDSSGGDHRAAFFKLSNALLLRKSMDQYYLNIQTPFGWEYIRFENLLNGDLLNISPFWFTGYNDKTGDEKVFLRSTEYIYPGMKAIHGKEDPRIIGLKAKMDPKKVKDSFDRTENDFVLLRIK